MYKQRAKSVLETSTKVTNGVIDPFRWLCEFFLKGLWLEGESFDISPKV